MDNKIPTKFKNIVNKHEDELVHHMQCAYNLLIDLVCDLRRDDDPNTVPLRNDYCRIREYLAQSIEHFYPGLCEETVNGEIEDLKKKIRNAKGVVAELEEKLGELLS